MDQEAMFSTASLVAAVEQLNKPHRWLESEFFGERTDVTDEFVVIEVEKCGRTLAPYVSPLHEGKVIDRGTRQVKVIKPAYLKPKMVTHAGEHLKRGLGEQLLGTATPGERDAAQLAKDLDKLSDTIYRRKEVMCRDALFDAKIVIKGDGVEELVDFGRDASLSGKLGGSSRWDQSGSDPIAAIREKCDLVLDKSGNAVTRLIMGKAALAAFLAHGKVKDKLDNRRMELGLVKPSQMPKGVVYVGSLMDPFVDIYTYTDWYVDPLTGLTVPMVPSKNVIFIADSARRVMHHGVIRDYDAGLAAMEIFPKSWVTKDPSVRHLMLQSAPMPVPVEVDATANFDVLTA